MVLGALAAAWMLPMGTVALENIRLVGPGYWVIDGTNRWLPTVSPVVAAGQLDFGLGEDYWLATKDRRVFQESKSPTVPVVHVFDPLHKWRRYAPDIPLPQVFSALPELVEIVFELQQREGRTEAESAREDWVCLAMQECRAETIEQIEECIALGVALGFLLRSAKNNNLQATWMGVMWSRLVTSQGLASKPMLSTCLTTSDLTDLVRVMITEFRNAVENGPLINALWQGGRHVDEPRATRPRSTRVQTAFQSEGQEWRARTASATLHDRRRHRFRILCVRWFRRPRPKPGELPGNRDSLQPVVYCTGILDHPRFHRCQEARVGLTSVARPTWHRA